MLTRHMAIPPEGSGDKGETIPRAHPLESHLGYVQVTLRRSSGLNGEKQTANGVYDAREFLSTGRSGRYNHRLQERTQ